MPRTRTYGLDIDTIRYAQRVKSGSGTTILPEPLKQINKFVIGVKKLGLWNSMTCWPMRSIHNAGTGSTVYSLGGFGPYNATSFNSPSWGNQGITFGNSSYLLTGAISHSNYLFNCSIFKFNTIDGTSQGLFGFTSNNRFGVTPVETTNLGRLFRTTNNSSVLDDYRFGFSLTTNTHYTYSAYVNGVNKVARLNRGSATNSKSFTSDIFNQTSSTVFIGAANNAGAASLKGSVAFTSLINITNNQTLENLFLFENLCRTTVGIGLNLP